MERYGLIVKHRTTSSIPSILVALKNARKLRYTIVVTHLQFAIVATDILILRKNEGVIEVAVQLVNRPPHYVNINGFIGGVLRPDETAEAAARRIIREKAGLDPKHLFLTPLKFYDAIHRDKRGRVISIAYLGIMHDAQKTHAPIRWVPLHATLRLAYDHSTMRSDTITYMKDHLFITTIALHFLPTEFTIAELKAVYDDLLGKTIDKRNFYKFIETLPIQPTQKTVQQGRGRPALLYKKLPKKGFFLP